MMTDRYFVVVTFSGYNGTKRGVAIAAAGFAQSGR